MKSTVLVLEGIPKPWAAPRITRRGHYDIRSNDKRAIIAKLKAKYRGPMIRGAIKADFFFAMQIPESTSAKKKQLMAAQKIYHVKKPDRDNLQKMYSDMLQMAGIIQNDSQIVDGSTKKFYHEKPHVLILLQELESGI
jgi:Holliday junction resolvase RusA-like endonuclease